MNIKALFMGVALFALPPSSLSAQSFAPHVAVSSGYAAVVWKAGSITPSCAAINPSINILRRPSHGLLKIEVQAAFPGYVPSHPLSKCNATAIPQKVVVYKSNPGYKGFDTAVVKTAFPDGSFGSVTLNITVK